MVLCKKIAILTSLSDISTSYSVAAAVYDQYSTIKEYGHEDFEVNVYCNESFNTEHMKHLNNDWHYTCPALELHRYKVNESPKENFDEQVSNFEKIYLDIAKANDIIITERIIFKKLNKGKLCKIINLDLFNRIK